jgi:hypothetical protein
MTRISIVVAVAALCAATLSGQTQRPDFSGTWKIDASRSTSTGGGQGSGRGEGNSRGGGLGLGGSPESIAIVQTAETMVVEEHRGVEVTRITYALDGKTMTNVVASGRSSGAKATYTSAWKGERLVTTIRIPGSPGGEIAAYQETRSLDGDGSLIIEIMMTGRPNSRKLVYVRAK